MPSQGRGARDGRPVVDISSRIGSSRSIGTNMFASIFSGLLFLHQQRANAEEPARIVDQRRAGPVRMRGCGEQRLIEHILPIACEFALGDDPGVECVTHATMADRNHP